MNIAGREYGFSFLEIIVVIAILTVLTTISLVSLGAMQERLLLRAAASDIVFALEAAKARSVAGTGGVVHGVHFTDETYVEFRGSTYDAEDDDVLVHELDPRLTLTTDTLSETSIVFARITGTTGAATEIMLALKDDPDTYRTILVGAGGAISYDE